MHQQVSFEEDAIYVSTSIVGIMDYSYVFVIFPCFLFLVI